MEVKAVSIVVERGAWYAEEDGTLEGIHVSRLCELLELFELLDDCGLALKAFPCAATNCVTRPSLALIL
jgi:hypothetical protein